MASKRNAVRIGVEMASGEVVVLLDSDTIWTEGTLAELLTPFADPRVGGVTIKQRILDPERNLLTRWEDWLENRAPPNPAGRAGLATTGDQARTYDPDHEPARPAM